MRRFKYPEQAKSRHGGGTEVKLTFQSGWCSSTRDLQRSEMMGNKPVPRIRKSRFAEGQRLVDIWHDAVLATHDFLSPDDFKTIAAEVAAFLPTASLWVATDGHDRATGFMLIEDGHLEALFIDPAWHGQGVGRALVSHALARHSGLTVDANEQNPLALGFYLHLGFVPIGRSERDALGLPYPLIHLRHGGVPQKAPISRRSGPAIPVRSGR